MGNSKQKRGGAKLSRSEVVTVRLDPKLRYFAELASRKQRRTLSSFIECAIEEYLKSEIIDHDSYDNKITFFDVTGLLWDTNETDRYLLLAKNYPHLLSHEEQLLWKLIKEFSVFDSSSKEVVRFYNSKSEKPDIRLVQTCWQELKGVIDGSVDEEALRKAMIANSFFDDIPF